MSFLKKAFNIHRELFMALFGDDIAIILTVASTISIIFLWRLYLATMPPELHNLFWIALILAYLNAIRSGLDRY